MLRRKEHTLSQSTSPLRSACTLCKASSDCRNQSCPISRSDPENETSEAAQYRASSDCRKFVVSYDPDDLVESFRGRHGGVEKRGGRKTSRMTPLPKRGFGPRLVRYVFHPLRCQCSVFPVQESATEQTRSSFGGVQNFSGGHVFSGTCFSPHTFCTLSGPVLRDTARLSLRYPHYCALWGFWCLNMAHWVRHPLPLFCAFPSWRACEVEVRYPPLKRVSQRYLRDTL